MSTKFEKNLAELVEAQVITPDISKKITDYYNSKTIEKPNRLLMIFGVLGALLSGLGIILIIAHNWDDMPKNLKTVFAFFPLVLGQIAAGFSFFKNKSATWKEASATFLFFAVAATISLISQIYHIPGDLSSFMLTWLILTVPLIYLIRSNIAVVLHLILATSYACNLGYFNSSVTPWYYVVMLILVIPYYRNLILQQPHSNSTGVLNWLFPLSITIALGAFVTSDTIGFLMYISLFGLLYNIGKLPWFAEQKLRRNGYSIIGSLGTIFILIMASFRWFWEEAYQETFNEQSIFITLFFIVMSVLILTFLHIKKYSKAFNLFQYAFLVFALIYAIRQIGISPSLVLINLLVFALGLFTIRIGANKGNYGILNYGLLIIAVLITCRFFDTDLNFIIRGILFMGVGAGFFSANYMLLKKQRKQQ